jgi:hypothetical protein
MNRSESKVISTADVRDWILGRALLLDALTVADVRPNSEEWVQKWVQWKPESAALPPLALLQRVNLHSSLW